MGQSESIERLLLEANSLYLSEAFFNATGMRLKFSVNEKKKLKNFYKKNIIVQQDPEKQSGREIGLISIENLRKAINIGQYIISVSDLKVITYTEDNICCICLELPVDIVLSCGHGYCEKDIIDWEARDKTCPLCRQSLNHNKMFTSLENFKDDSDLQQSLDDLFCLISKF